jgi:UDP-sugar pyrophosphorylase
LKDSLDLVNPYEGYDVHIPQGESLSLEDLDRLTYFEEIGVKELSKTCFVLVAGGLGERLGYDGIKVGIPIELVTKQTFLEYYISYILAF